MTPTHGLTAGLYSTPTGVPESPPITKEKAA